MLTPSLPTDGNKSNFQRCNRRFPFEWWPSRNPCIDKSSPASLIVALIHRTLLTLIHCSGSSGLVGLFLRLKCFHSTFPNRVPPRLVLLWVTGAGPLRTAWSERVKGASIGFPTSTVQTGLFSTGPLGQMPALPAALCLALEFLPLTHQAEMRPLPRIKPCWSSGYPWTQTLYQTRGLIVAFAS